MESGRTSQKRKEHVQRPCDGVVGITEQGGRVAGLDKGRAAGREVKRGWKVAFVPTVSALEGLWLGEMESQ